MKKGKAILVNIDMFPEGVLLFLPVRDVDFYEEILLKLVKMKKDEVEEWRECFNENKDANGFVSMNTDRGGIWQAVVFTDHKSWKETLVHEALHAVERLCDYRNIPIKRDTEELRAMLLGAIVKKSKIL